MNFRAICTIARQEFAISMRGRWILLFSAVFAVLSLAISYFGTVTAGAAGIEGFERTTASLLNLVLFLVPLLGLTQGTLNLSRDRGANELLFSQPVSRGQILYGRLLGLFASMSLSMLLGFGAAALTIFAQIGPEGALRFAGLIAVSLTLAAVFLSLGALAGLLCDSRTKAFGLSLFLWFFFVLFYDLLVIGTAFLIPERVANTLIFASLFANPVDLARVSSLLAVADPTIFGAAGAALLKFAGGPAAAWIALCSGLALWIATALFCARRIVSRLDL